MTSVLTDTVESNLPSTPLLKNRNITTSGDISEVKKAQPFEERKKDRKILLERAVSLTKAVKTKQEKHTQEVQSTKQQAEQERKQMIEQKSYYEKLMEELKHQTNISETAKAKLEHNNMQKITNLTEQINQRDVELANSDQVVEFIINNLNSLLNE